MDNSENTKPKGVPPPLPSLAPPPLTKRRSNSSTTISSNTAAAATSESASTIRTTTTNITEYVVNNRENNNDFSNYASSITNQLFSTLGNDVENKYSILITPLNDQIRTTSDIDVKVIPLSSVSTNTTTTTSTISTIENEAIKRRRVNNNKIERNFNETSEFSTQFDYAESERKNKEKQKESTTTATTHQSIECQTDFKISASSGFKTLPVHSDVELIDVYYFDTDSTKYNVISDDEINDNDTYTLYTREANPRTKRAIEPLKYKTASVQTQLTVFPDKHRSTQTSPSLLREYVMSDLTNYLPASTISTIQSNDARRPPPRKYSKDRAHITEHILDNSLSSEAELTSFEQPIYENPNVKEAIIYKDVDERSDNTGSDSNKPPKIINQRAESMNTLSGNSTTYYTVATHVTVTTTDNSNTGIKEYFSISEDNFDYEKVSEKEIINSFANHGQLIKLNKTSSNSSLNDQERDAQADNNMGGGGQSDRTSLISDEGNETDENQQQQQSNQNDNKSTLPILGKLLFSFDQVPWDDTEITNETNKNFIESKLVKDKVETHYPVINNVTVKREQVQFINNNDRKDQNTVLETQNEMRRPSVSTSSTSSLEIDVNVNYDIHKVKKDKSKVIDCNIERVDYENNQYNNNNNVKNENLLEPKKKITFNEELDIIEPSEYSTTSTNSNIQNLSDVLSPRSKLEELVQDDNETTPPLDEKKFDEYKDVNVDAKSPFFDPFSSFKWQEQGKNKVTDEKTDKVLVKPRDSKEGSLSVSSSNSWDDTPVKPYNSGIPSIGSVSAAKALYESNLKKNLNRFDLREIKSKEIKYVEKPGTSQTGQKLQLSDSVKSRLIASGFMNNLVPISLDTESTVQDKQEDLPPPPPLPVSSPPRSPTPPPRPPPPVIQTPIVPPRISSKLEIKDRPMTAIEVDFSAYDENKTVKDKETENAKEQNNKSNIESSGKQSPPIILNTYEEVQQIRNIIKTQVTDTVTTFIEKASDKSPIETSKPEKEEQNKPIEYENKKKVTEEIKLNEQIDTKLVKPSEAPKEQNKDKKVFDVDLSLYEEDTKESTTVHHTDGINESLNEERKSDSVKSEIFNANEYVESTDENDGNPETYTLEFITEDDLGPNYEENYFVQIDDNTGELYILDNYNYIRYIIVRNTERLDNRIIVDYVEKQLLDEMGGFEINEDEESGEFNIQHPIDINRMWIVLPIGWRTVDLIPYIDENDVDETRWKVYREKKTNRKYIIDDSTGDHYYVVPPFDEDHVSKFKKIWSNNYSKLRPRHSSLSRESKMIFGGKNIKNFDVDLNSYNESPSKNKQIEAGDNSNSTQQRQHSISASYKMTMNEERKEKTFDFDENAYNEERKPKIIDDKEFTVDAFYTTRETRPAKQPIKSQIKSEEADADIEAPKPIKTKERNHSLSSESRFILSENNRRTFDIDLNEYNEPRRPSKVSVSSLDLSGSEDRNRSLSREARLNIENKQRKQFDIDFSEYNEQKPQPKVIKYIEEVVDDDNDNQKLPENKQKPFGTGQYNEPRRPSQLSVSSLDVSVSEERKRSLSREAKLNIENKQRKQFDVDFSIYNEEKPQPKVIKYVEEVVDDGEDNQKLPSDEEEQNFDRFNQFYVDPSRRSRESTHKMLLPKDTNKQIDVDYASYNENSKLSVGLSYDEMPRGRGSGVLTEEETSTDVTVIDRGADGKGYGKRSEIKDNTEMNSSFRGKYDSKDITFDNYERIKKLSRDQENVSPNRPVKLYTDWGNLLDMVEPTNSDDGGAEADIDDENDERLNSLNSSKKQKKNSNGIPTKPGFYDDEQNLNYNAQKPTNTFSFEKPTYNNNNNINNINNSSQNSPQLKRIRTNNNDKTNTATNNKENNQKITVSALAPPKFPSNTNLAAAPNTFSTQVSKSEIKPNITVNRNDNDEYSRLIDVTGHNPPNAPRSQKNSPRTERVESKPSSQRRPDLRLPFKVPDASTLSSQAGKTSITNLIDAKDSVSLSIHDETDGDGDFKINEAILRKRLRHQSGASGADSSSIITETSQDIRLIEQRRSELIGTVTELDNTSASNNSKVSRIQKIMLALADRERQKLQKRMQVRKQRIPEIIELLKTAKGKEKTKLEEELQLLTRKSKRDEQLMKKFQLNQTNGDSTSSLANTTDQEKSKKPTKSKSVNELNKNNLDDDENNSVFESNPTEGNSTLPRARSESGGNNTNLFNAVYNDGYLSPTFSGNNVAKLPKLSSLRASGTARESGYSSCDESGNEARHRRLHSSSQNSDTKLDRVDDDDNYATIANDDQIDAQMEPISSKKSAIKSVVNKLQIDSSPFVNNSSNTLGTRILTKSPTLQMGYSEKNGLDSSKIIRPLDPNYAIDAQQSIQQSIIRRQSSKLSDLSYEQIPHDAYQPINVSVTSSDTTDRYRINSLRPQDYDELNRTNETRFTPNGRRFVDTNSPYEHDSYGRTVPMDVIPGSTYYGGENNVTRTTNIRPPVNNYVKNTSNPDPVRTGNQTSTFKSSTNTNPSLQQQAASFLTNQFQRNNEDDDDKRKKPPSRQESLNKSFDSLKIKYVLESDLSPNYEEEMIVERDPQTGELFIMDYDKNIKYVIIKNDDSRNGSYATKDTRKPSRDQESEEEDLIVEYIEEGMLHNLRDVSVYEDRVTGESFIQSPNDPTRRWIVLPNNWRDMPSYPYIAEEDIDYDELTVYVDSRTKRKYIVDERTGQRYYIVPKINQNYIKNFEKQWQVLSGLLMRFNLNNERNANAEPVNESQIRSEESEKNKRKPGFQIQWPSNDRTRKPTDKYQYESDASDVEINTGTTDKGKKLERSGVNQTSNVDSLLVKDDETIIIAPKRPERRDSDIRESPRDSSDEVVVYYVEQDDLDKVDLSDVPIYENPNTNEYYIQHPKQPNKVWIILPRNWQEDENNTYITQDDVDSLKWTPYVEPNTGRSYIVDDKTGQRYYVVPRYDDFRDTFLYQWRNLEEAESSPSNLVVWRKKQEPVKPGETTDPKPSSIKKPSGLPFIKTDTDYPDIIETLETEPGKIIPHEHQQIKPTKTIIKQPGKAGQPTVYTTKRAPVKKPFTSRADLAIPLVLSRSPRPLHHLLFEDKEKHRQLSIMSDDMYSLEREKQNEEDRLRSISSASMMGRKTWRSSQSLIDPTAAKDKDGKPSPQLDRNKLAEVQIYGYRKDAKLDRKSGLSSKRTSRSNPYLSGSWSGSGSPYARGPDGSPYLRGVLTESFKQDKLWQRNHRGLTPRTRLYLKEQILATPRSQIKSWSDTLNKSYKLKPRIIIINDDEHIVAADKNCKLYVQYMYENDSVLGANPAYQLMLPDRGPVNPTRPLLVTPKQLHKIAPDVALREAPVYVYHPDGSAYFENIAQYLAGKYPKLSPKTARKMLQFKNMEEFEDYLESKMTRDEAKRISEMSGNVPVDVESIKQDLMSSLSYYSPKASSIRSTRSDMDAPHYYHNNCEYDPLRSKETTLSRRESNKQFNETQEINVDGVPIKSTFLSFMPSGRVERVDPNDLPQSVYEVIKEADTNQNNNNNNIRNDTNNNIRPDISGSNFSRPLISSIRSDTRSSTLDSSQNNQRPRGPLIPLDERNNLLQSRYNK